MDQVRDHTGRIAHDYDRMVRREPLTTTAGAASGFIKMGEAAHRQLVPHP